MTIINKGDYFKSIRRLRKRLGVLLDTPMYEGRSNIENIRLDIDDWAVELISKYCDIDRVISKLKEIRKQKHGR